MHSPTCRAMLIRKCYNKCPQGGAGSRVQLCNFKRSIPSRLTHPLRPPCQRPPSRPLWSACSRTWVAAASTCSSLLPPYCGLRHMFAQPRDSTRSCRSEHGPSWPLEAPVLYLPLLCPPPLPPPQLYPPYLHVLRVDPERLDRVKLDGLWAREGGADEEQALLSGVSGRCSWGVVQWWGAGVVMKRWGVCDERWRMEIFLAAG